MRFRSIAATLILAGFAFSLPEEGNARTAADSSMPPANPQNSRRDRTFSFSSASCISIFRPERAKCSCSPCVRTVHHEHRFWPYVSIFKILIFHIESMIRLLYVLPAQAGPLGLRDRPPCFGKE